MDTYEVGNYIRRWGQFRNEQGELCDPEMVVCYVADPSGRTGVRTLGGGGVTRQAKGVYFWHMIARCAGEWSERWTEADGLTVSPDKTEHFCVEEILPDVPPKTFPCLSDGPDLTLKPLTSEHLELLRKWRNRDDIRRWFFTSDLITEAQQLRWFYSVYLPDQGDLMWIAYHNGDPVGTGAKANGQGSSSVRIAHAAKDWPGASWHWCAITRWMSLSWRVSTAHCTPLIKTRCTLT